MMSGDRVSIETLWCLVHSMEYAVLDLLYA
jgi:hypothetical protein